MQVIVKVERPRRGSFHCSFGHFELAGAQNSSHAHFIHSMPLFYLGQYGACSICRVDVNEQQYLECLCEVLMSSGQINMRSLFFYRSI